MVTDRITEILRLVFLQVKDKLDAKYGCFEVFGVDFLLGEDLSPRLMEINSNPSFSCELEDSREYIKTLLRDVITMASDLHESNKTSASREYIKKVFSCA